MSKSIKEQVEEAADKYAAKFIASTLANETFIECAELVSPLYEAQGFMKAVELLKEYDTFGNASKWLKREDQRLGIIPKCAAMEGED